MFFLEEMYNAKIPILKILRAPSICHEGICLKWKCKSDINHYSDQPGRGYDAPLTVKNGQKLRKKIRKIWKKYEKIQKKEGEIAEERKSSDSEPITIDSCHFLKRGSSLLYFSHFEHFDGKSEPFWRNVTWFKPTAQLLIVAIDLKCKIVNNSLIPVFGLNGCALKLWSGTSPDHIKAEM